MKLSTKVVLVATVVGTLGLGNLARVVQARQAPLPVAVMPQSHMVKSSEASDGDGEVNDSTEASKLVGSQSQTVNSARIAAELPEASDGDGETNDDGQQQDSQLQSLAKITRQQAQRAAESTQMSRLRASSIKLENENGNLVYAMVLGQKEVKVDAGNG